MFTIWQPRYKDNVVLLATYKIEKGKNLIQFTKAKHLEGMTFEIDSDVIQECPIESNGKIPCYAVPMELLKKVI